MEAPRSPSNTTSASSAAAAAAAADITRDLFITAFIVTAQNGFGHDVDPFLALCHETWDEEVLWDAVKDLPHGCVRREGPTTQGAAEPFRVRPRPVQRKAHAADVRGAKGRRGAAAVAQRARRAAGAKGLGGADGVVLG
jgi:hypothetical protein